MAKKEGRRVAEISKGIEVQGNPIVSDKLPPLLLGTVFTARRVIRVENSHSLGAKAKLSVAQSLIEKLGLGSAFEASAAGSSEGTEAVVIELRSSSRSRSHPRL